MTIPAPINTTAAQIRSITSVSAATGALNSVAGQTDHVIIAPNASNTGGKAITIQDPSSLAQNSTITIPDPGAATANVVLDTGTASSITATAVTATKLSTGATPVPMVDPGSCTITPAAGSANVCNLTIQLKDGSGTNIARSVRFKLYASSAADGLTLASAASTGFAVASGGLSLANGTAVTTQIEVMSSATGGAVVSLTDTGKATSYIVLALPTGNKISAQLTSGNYG